MEKKMGTLMSVISDIRRKQDDIELAFEMKLMSQPTLTANPRHRSAPAPLSPVWSTPGRKLPWYISDSFAEYTPKPSQPSHKLVPTTSLEAPSTIPTTLSPPPPKSASTSQPSQPPYPPQSQLQFNQSTIPTTLSPPPQVSFIFTTYYRFKLSH